jgi:hypothetical protein
MPGGVEKVSRILGIDPGPNQSADVIWDSKENKILTHFQGDNQIFIMRVKMAISQDCFDAVVVEDVAFYGKVLNRETFNTLKFIGRIQQLCWPCHHLIVFPDVAYHFCNSRRGVKQSQINAVLTDRFGGKGTRKQPGILYGIKEHEWSALACAVYWSDVNK